MLRTILVVLVLAFSVIGQTAPPPGILYSGYLAGTHEEVATAIAVDSNGYLYVAGFTDSSDFPTTPGAFKRSISLPWQGCRANSGCGAALFLTKLTPDGKALAYSTYLAEGLSAGPQGNSGLRIFSLAVSSSGEAIIAGESYANSFGVAETSTSSCLNGALCGFVARVSADGSRLLAIRYLGSGGHTTVYAVTLAPDGTIFAAGNTTDKSFPVTSGTFQASPPPNCCTRAGLPGNTDAFVIKLDPLANTILAGTYIGGSGGDAVVALALTSTGQLLIGGSTNSPDFPTTRSHGPSLSGRSSAFLGTLPQSLTSFDSTLFGGTKDNAVYALNPLNDGSILVTGQTSSSDFPVSGSAFQGSFRGGLTDTFVAKFSSVGSIEVSTYLGGSGSDVQDTLDIPRYVTVLTGNRILVVGETNSADFPVHGSRKPAIDGGNCGLPFCKDVFVTVLNGTATKLESSILVGGSGDEAAFSAVQAIDRTWIVGSTTGLDTTDGAFQNALLRSDGRSGGMIAALYYGKQDFRINVDASEKQFSPTGVAEFSLTLEALPFISDKITLRCISDEVECTFANKEVTLYEKPRTINLVVRKKTLSGKQSLPWEALCLSMVAIVLGRRNVLKGSFTILALAFLISGCALGNKAIQHSQTHTTTAIVVAESSQVSHQANLRILSTNQ